MADNVVASAAVGTGATFATIAASWSGDTANFGGSFLVIASGSEGSWTVNQIVGGAGAVSAGVQRMTLASDDPAVAALGGVSDAAATQGSTGSISAKLRTVTSQLNTIASGIPVTNAGVFATQAAQSGTWNITNVSGTVSLPTGAATSAKQPALGTAGTASADVITVQGIASMTALKVDGSAVTQPVSGTISVSGTVTVDSELTTADLDTGAGTDTRAVVGLVLAASGGGVLVGSANPLPISDNSGSITVDNSGTFATQATQSGTWNIGTVTTCSTVTNLSQLGGNAIAMGTGVRSSGTQRVTIATDDIVPASQSGTWTVGISASQTIAVTNAGTFATQATLQAGTALVGRTSASQETSTLYNGTTALTPKFSKISASSSGDNTLVAAVTSKKIRILSMFLLASGTVNAYVHDDAGSPVALIGDSTNKLALIANMGFVLPDNPKGWNETTSGQALVLNLSGAVSVAGVMSYVEV